jgi:uncharacterized protein YneF (UPF0154 family)
MDRHIAPHTPERPPITVKEARKLLGQDGIKLSDTQVYEIIADLHLIAQKYLRLNGSNNMLGV